MNVGHFVLERALQMRKPVFRTKRIKRWNKEFFFLEREREREREREIKPVWSKRGGNPLACRQYCSRQ